MSCTVLFHVFESVELKSNGEYGELQRMLVVPPRDKISCVRDVFAVCTESFLCIA